MITSSPLSELDKLELYKTFSQCKSADGLLADPIVFCLVLILILLTPVNNNNNGVSGSGSDAHVKYESLLRKYLQQQRGCDVTPDMVRIQSCVSMLPTLAELVASMRKAQ